MVNDLALSAAEAWTLAPPEPIARIELPAHWLVERRGAHGPVRFAGDIRVADCTGDGRLDVVAYRSRGGAVAGEGMKPCWLAACDASGRELWQIGEPGSGEMPARPGPVTIHDLDDDGRSEVVHFFASGPEPDDPRSMADVVVQLRAASDGTLIREARFPELAAMSGEGANWVHQRLLVADLRGKGHAGDVVVKVGTRIIAFTDQLELLWIYDNPNDRYQRCPAYIPAVGDIDGDGRDEVLGGYYQLGPDGRPRWERVLGRNMDSVCFAPWDDGRLRAFASGAGHVLDSEGAVLLRLGPERVPHGQELRVADFLGEGRTSMAIRWNGHAPDLIVVDQDGRSVRDLVLNDSHNHTGMEALAWGERAVLFNGGRLWDLATGASIALPGLPEVPAHGRMSWWHAIPVDLRGDASEEVVAYNPYHPAVFVYGRSEHAQRKPFRPDRRTVNARLMD